MHLFRQRFLPSSLLSFQKLRRLVDLVVDDIVEQIHPGTLTARPSAGHDDYRDDVFDVESGAPTRRPFRQRSVSRAEVTQLDDVSRRLRAECSSFAPTESAPVQLDDGRLQKEPFAKIDECMLNTPANRPAILRQLFKLFADTQVAVAADTIATGALADSDVRYIS
jgi:hypothetical protein